MKKNTRMLHLCLCCCSCHLFEEARGRLMLYSAAFQREIFMSRRDQKMHIWSIWIKMKTTIPKLISDIREQTFFDNFEGIAKANEDRSPARDALSPFSCVYSVETPDVSQLLCFLQNEKMFMKIKEFQMLLSRYRGSPYKCSFIHVSSMKWNTLWNKYNL